MSERIGIIGAGSWGTALAISLAKAGKDVQLWARSKQLVEEMRETRINRVYLGDIPIPGSVRIDSSLDAVTYSNKILVFATPSQSAREVGQQAAASINAGHVLVSVAKGVENDSLKLASEVLEDIAPVVSREQIGVLYGPSHAEEVARGIPTAVVASAYHRDTAKLIQNVFLSSSFRVYINLDMVGVQIGGAVKNVMAIAAGISDGVGFGDNTKAAIVTRGISEIRRLGVAMGAKPETFSGLAGIGDLVVTCMSGLSRNRYLGEQVGKGRSMDAIVQEMKMVAEGVRTTQSIVALAKRYFVEMPITEAVYRILFEGKKPLEAVSELMEREAKEEHWIA